MNAALLSKRPITVLVLGTLGLLVGLAAVIGSDVLWLVALGEEIIERGTIPQGVPFAAAPSGSWANVPVLAEVCLAVVWRLGSAAPLVLAVALTAVAWALLAIAAARRGGRDLAVAVVMVGVAAGSVTTWGVVRLQTLSFVPFALICLLLGRESARPSRGVWLIPPLVALWGNMHGAVLVGVALVGVYLVVERLRRTPRTAIAVGVASIAALWANPAGLRTVDYYRGVAGNEAFASGTHLWSGLDLGHAGDRVLVGVAVLLVVVGARRMRPWEIIAVVGLGAATVIASRNGMWLLFVLAAPGAAGLSGLGEGILRTWQRPVGRLPIEGRLIRERGLARGLGRGLLGGVASVPRVAPVVAVVLLVFGGAFAAARPHPVAGVDLADATAISSLAGPRVILAPEPFVEALAVSGARVWMTDPLDAFSPADQRVYLAFLDAAGGLGSAPPEVPSVVDLVVVPRSSALDDRLVAVGFQPWTSPGLPAQWLVYRRA